MKAVILAAGKGTRLDPLTKYRPKHLLPIAGNPLIENIISALKNIGIKDVYIIVGYRDQEIRKLIGDGGKYDLRVTYVTQREQLGTAHAIKMVKEYLKNEEFLVVYGDVTVEDKTLLQAIEKHRESRATTTIVSIEVEDPWNYGVMELGEGNILKNIIEKPERGREPSRQINAGIYVMRGREIFEAIEETPMSKRGEYEITDTFKILLGKGEKVAVCITKGRWWRDVGRPWDLLEANEEYMNRSEYYGRILIGKGSILRGKCIMIPPLIIGERCIIGEGTVLGPYTYIGNDVEVGFKSRIVKSIILEKTIILNNVDVRYSIIASNCIVEGNVVFECENRDKSNVKMRVKGVEIDTGKRSFGSVIGDYSFIGGGSRILPGTTIYPNSLVTRGKIVYFDVDGPL